MVRYIKSVHSNSPNYMTLCDLIGDAKMQVVFVDELNIYNRSAIEGSTNVDYSAYSDSELLDLDDEERRKIDDVQTIVRLAKLNPKLLTPGQKTIADDEFWKKVITPKSNVKKILSDLKTKTVAYFMPGYDENDSFLESNGISADDALYAVQHLSIGDYVANTTNTIPKYYGDELIIFEPTRALPLKNGGKISNTIIYMKIDLDKSKNKGVYLISFHPTNYEDYKPYK